MNSVQSFRESSNFLRLLFSIQRRNYYKNNRRMRAVSLPRSGDKMPTVGLGTWQAPSDVVEATVYKALEMGYRHIDTAFNYNNEEPIGSAIKCWLEEGKGKREDLFITTKLPHIGNRASDVSRFLEMQLNRLQLDYIDLYLIHVPFGFACHNPTLTPVVDSFSGEYKLDLVTDHISIWKEMEECQRSGLIRNLGVSNFNEKQIKRLIYNCTLRPQVLQVEVHANFQQMELRKFCADNSIVVTAYAPLGSPGAKLHFVNKYNYKPEAFPDVLGDSQVVEMAAKHRKTPAQILLNFLVSQGVVVIPKSTNEERLKENLDIYDFQLSGSEVNILKKLDKGDNGRIFDFLFWKGVHKHPEYPFKIKLSSLSEVESNFVEPANFLESTPHTKMERLQLGFEKPVGQIKEPTSKE